MRCKTSQVLLLLKTAIFIGLSAVFYVFYFTTVAQKYAEGHTTVVVSQERRGQKLALQTLIGYISLRTFLLFAFKPQHSLSLLLSLLSFSLKR